MALVNVINMLVLNNPTQFTSPFAFEITFECLQELDDDLEWRIFYVGNVESSQDLLLDEILVGPVPVGTNKFILSCDAPDYTMVKEILGVTVVLVTCSYRDREFIRVGYYVNNEYCHDDNDGTTGATSNNDEDRPPPVPLDINKVHRQILADKPRVTKFPIPWGDAVTEEEPPPQEEEEPNGTQETEETEEGEDEEEPENELDEMEDPT